MSIVDHLFKKKQPQVDIDLVALRLWFQGMAPRLENEKIEPELVRAQLADHYRDLDVAPIDPFRFDELTTPLDDEGWRRLALVASVFADHEIARVMPLLLQNTSADKLVTEGAINLAKSTKLLTMELLRQSSLRVEEFARHFAIRLGVGVLGETLIQSKQRLKRLDYSRLLAEAARAKASAEERMGYLKKLQEEQEARLAPRGKW